MEFVTDRSQEGAQFCRGFGGIGGILRWKIDFAEMDVQLNEMDVAQSALEEKVAAMTVANGGSAPAPVYTNNSSSATGGDDYRVTSSNNYSSNEDYDDFM